MDYIFVKSTKKGMEDHGSIYARVRTKDSNLKLALGFTIKRLEWEKYKSLQFTSSAVMSSLGIKYGQFAQIMTQLKTAFEEEDFKPQDAKSVVESIKHSVLNSMVELVTVKPKGKILFLDYILQYRGELESGKRLKRQRAVKVSEAYLKGLRIMEVSIRRYERERHRKLGIDDINMDFQRDYITYLKDRGLMPNAINSYMTDIRTLMRGAYEAKLTQCDDFRNSGFVPKKEEVDNIYLTPDQITEMLNLDLSSKEAVIKAIKNCNMSDEEKKEHLAQCRITHVRTLEHARDVFIVGCLTGQRVSDYQRINKDMITNIGGSDFLRITQKKTEKTIYIPLDKRVCEILDKYNGKVPHICPNELNKLIKVIGMFLNWTWQVDFDPKKLNPRRGTRFCDMILSHTARRSFATNAYAAGVPLQSILAVTGHSSEAQLRRYLKLTAEEKAVQAYKDFQGIIKM
jgi:integrase